jgi:predicted nucleic acid-binding protein
MKYVLDSCVGVKWALVEQGTPQARKLRDDYRGSAVELVAPDVFPVEFVHAITRAERQQRITPEEGAQLLADVLANLPKMHESLPLLPRAYEISSSLRIGVYDSLYVALAEREQCELVTVDDRLLGVLQGQFPQVVHLTSLP